MSTDPAQGPGSLGGSADPLGLTPAGLGLGGGLAPFGATGRGPRLLSSGGRKATVISTVSTLVVLAGLASVFWLAPGSAAFRHAFFSPQNMWDSFFRDPKQGSYSVAGALWRDIRMFLAAEALILSLSL